MVEDEGWGVRGRKEKQSLEEELVENGQERMPELETLQAQKCAMGQAEIVATLGQLWFIGSKRLWDFSITGQGISKCPELT